MRKQLRSTKIISTIGPRTANSAIQLKLIKAGANIFRLNFAHGTHQEHKNQIHSVRRLSKTTNRPLGILQDLPGPKIRVGKLSSNPLELKRNERIILSGSPRKNRRDLIPISYRNLHKDIKPGQTVYIADGFIRLVVTKIRGEEVHCRVAHEGVIRSGNGVNLPDTPLNLKAFTKEDEKHLAFGLHHRVDFIGISFVGNASDIDRVRRFCRKTNHKPLLIAKIERKTALKNLPDIIKAADGIMVARGDLGVEVSFAEIPGHQQRIVELAREYGKPVIVATQVLESMVDNPRPTRAEATDIANAIREGADGIMLSGETAVGRYPIDSVKALSRVINAAEKSFRITAPFSSNKQLNDSDLVCKEACDLAKHVKAPIILVPTLTGHTVPRISRFRPPMPIISVAQNNQIRRRFSLLWGVHTLPFSSSNFISNLLLSKLRNHIKRNHLGESGQMVVLVSSGPGVPKGETGLIQLLKI